MGNGGGERGGTAAFFPLSSRPASSQIHHPDRKEKINFLGNVFNKRKLQKGKKKPNLLIPTLCVPPTTDPFLGCTGRLPFCSS